MLNVILKNHDFKYEVAELIKLFTSDFQFVENKSFGMVLENNLLEYNNTLISTSKYYENYELRFESSENIKIDGLSEQELKKRTKEMIKRSMFNVLKKKFNTYVPWGILTGIRPVKIVHNLLDKGMSDEYIRQNLKENYLIMDEKIDLAIEKTREFFEGLGIKTHLSDYGIQFDEIEHLVKALKDHGRVALSETGKITLDVSRKILEGAI